MPQNEDDYMTRNVEEDAAIPRCPNCGDEIGVDDDHCGSPECKKAYEDYLNRLSKQYRG